VSVSPGARRRPRRRRRGRVVPWRLLIAIVAVICVFGAGIALGEALHDNPKPGGTTTTERTLRPLPLVPQTVTVTVGGRG
jgi:hypothetical protein